MKKIVGLILIFIVIMSIAVTGFATNSVLDDENTTTITGNQYQDAQKNTQNNDTTLPQTGVENYGTSILLVIFAASAIFAYKKVNDYRDI